MGASSSTALKDDECSVATKKNENREINTKATRHVTTVSKDEAKGEKGNRKDVSFDITAQYEGKEQNQKIANGVLCTVNINHINKARKSSLSEINAKREGKEHHHITRGIMTTVNINSKDSDPAPNKNKEIKTTAVKKASPPVWNDITAATSKLKFKKPVTFTSLSIPLDKTRAKEPPVAEQDRNFVRSPICCLMGQAGVGKTKLLDCLRSTNDNTNVQQGYVPETIAVTTLPAPYMRKKIEMNYKVKFGSLVLIDLPGHESFANLRALGSGVCDFAILVVDIMHGFQPQTVESLNLLKLRNTKFIIALNKVDNLRGWKTCHNISFLQAIRQQSEDVKYEFSLKMGQVVAQLKEHGFDANLFCRNDIGGESIHIVPTIANRGDGILDLMRFLVYWINSTMLEKKIAVSPWNATEIVSVNGMLHEQEGNAVYILQGPVATAVRVLLACRLVNPALEDKEG